MTSMRGITPIGLGLLLGFSGLVLTGCTDGERSLPSTERYGLDELFVDAAVTIGEIERRAEFKVTVIGPGSSSFGGIGGGREYLVAGGDDVLSVTTSTGTQALGVIAEPLPIVHGTVVSSLPGGPVELALDRNGDEGRDMSFLLIEGFDFAVRAVDGVVRTGEDLFVETTLQTAAADPSAPPFGTVALRARNLTCVSAFDAAEISVSERFGRVSISPRSSGTFRNRVSLDELIGDTDVPRRLGLGELSECTLVLEGEHVSGYTNGVPGPGGAAGAPITSFSTDFSTANLRVSFAAQDFSVKVLP